MVSFDFEVFDFYVEEFVLMVEFDLCLKGFVEILLIVGEGLGEFGEVELLLMGEDVGYMRVTVSQGVGGWYYLLFCYRLEKFGDCGGLVNYVA